VTKVKARMGRDTKVKLQKQLPKGFNFFVILGAWILYKHRNSCIFDGAAPNLQEAFQAFKDEFHLSQISGAKGLFCLEPRRICSCWLEEF